MELDEITLSATFNILSKQLTNNDRTRTLKY